MKVQLHVYESEKTGCVFETVPEAGYLSGNVEGSLMTIDICKNILEKIGKIRNGMNGKIEFGGNAAFAILEKDGVKILGLDAIEDGTEPIVYLSLDEYEHIVKLWKEFLETRKEVQTTIEIGNNSVLWEEAQSLKERQKV